MSRFPSSCFLIACAWAFVIGEARADERTSRESAFPDSRREVVLGAGFGPIIAPAPLTIYDAAKSAARGSTFTGLSLEVTTRRFPMFEFGSIIWSAAELSDWQGGYGHTLSRWTAEGRVLPWRFATFEPWIGGEFGVALATDAASWSETDKERAHNVSTTRLGSAAALHVGARFRATDLIAVNLRAGLLFLGFRKAPAAVRESDATPTYYVNPTDYGRRVWLSLTLSAELTAPD